MLLPEDQVMLEDIEFKNVPQHMQVPFEEYFGGNELAMQRAQSLLILPNCLPSGEEQR